MVPSLDERDFDDAQQEDVRQEVSHEVVETDDCDRDGVVARRDAVGRRRVVNEGVDKLAAVDAAVGIAVVVGHEDREKTAEAAHDQTRDQ